MTEIKECWAEQWGGSYLVMVTTVDGQTLRHRTAFDVVMAANSLVDQVIAKGAIQKEYWRG